MSVPAVRDLRIVVVGAGPSGCYVAGALKRSFSNAQIVVLDRLPTPFGLVRYGVAADHQSTKAISRQFDRLFTKEGIEFLGHVSVASKATVTAVTLDELRGAADIVVLATGLSSDRGLGIPGEDLVGIWGAGTLTRVLNSHPDESEQGEVIGRLGSRVAIVGLGNVAVDIVRFLSKPASGFDGSDINDDALGAYLRAPASVVDVYSRSSISQAKCDAQMIRELGQISGVRVTLHGEIEDPDSEDRTEQSRMDALRELAAATASTAEPRVEVRLHFGKRPVQLIGESRVTGAVFENALGTLEEISVDSVITAVGFAAEDERLFPESGDGGGSRLGPGLYRVGWCRRGPNGTIPENRADAMSVASQIKADLEAGLIPEKHGSAPLIRHEIVGQAVTYTQWLEIDREECASAPEGRVRRKISDTKRMLDLASPNAVRVQGNHHTTSSTTESRQP